MDIVTDFDCGPNASLLIRTDFSDDAAWLRTYAAATADPPADAGDEWEFGAQLDCVVERAFDGWSIDQLTAHITTRHPEVGAVFVADTRAQQDDDHPVLLVETYDDHGEFDAPLPSRYTRIAAAEMYAVQPNIMLANMDFEDFADTAEQTGGVFRGFSDDD